jgi:Tfp pilus assembly protein PilZ
LPIELLNNLDGAIMKVFDPKTRRDEKSHGEEVRMREHKVWADNELNLHMEKRAYRRVPANLQARVLYGNLIYSGKVTDISENGMFINTKVNFPVNAVFILIVLVNDCVTKIPIKVKRTVKSENKHSDNTACGIGVELVNAPQNYLDYVKSCKAAA